MLPEANTRRQKGRYPMIKVLQGILKLLLHSVNSVSILYRTGNMQSAILLLFVAYSSLSPCVFQSTHLRMPCYISPYVYWQTGITNSNWKSGSRKVGICEQIISWKSNWCTDENFLTWKTETVEKKEVKQVQCNSIGQTLCDISQESHWHMTINVRVYKLQIGKLTFGQPNM